MDNAPPAASAAGPATCPLTVIICTYCRTDLCRETVGHVAALLPPDSELIIVDQSPGALALQPAQLPAIPAGRLSLLRLDSPGMTRARNAGIRAARGEIMLFLDDDVIPEAGLLAAHLETYAAPRVGGVAGLVRHAGETQTEGPDPRMQDPVTGWLHCHFNHRSPLPVPTARGCNMSFRRSLLLEIGGFDENLVLFRDDTDVSFCIRRLGWEIRFVPTAGLLHLYANSGGTRGDGRANRVGLLSKLRYEWGFHRHFRDDLYFTAKHFSGENRRRLCRLALRRRLETAARSPHRALVRLHYPLALLSALRLLRRPGHRLS